MSGLNQQFTKLSILNWIREFESHRLRRFKKASPDGRLFYSTEASEQTALLTCEIRKTFRYRACEIEKYLATWWPKSVLAVSPPPQIYEPYFVRVIFDRESEIRTLEIFL